MQGVITRVHVLTHPVVVAESFGVRVLLRALFADAKETFLEIVSRCAEEEDHAEMADVGLARTVKRFIGFECRMRDLYRGLARRFARDAEAAAFFQTLAFHEEGHALVLSRVRRELRKGRLWKRTRDLHVAAMAGFEATLDGHEAELARGLTLARALEITEAVEGSEINVVFDTLNGSVDMRSRARFERFFVLTRRHLAFVRERVEALRARDRVAAGDSAPSGRW